MVRNREAFGAVMPGVAHMRHSWSPDARFTRGQPEKGAELADDLQRCVDLFGSKSIAACFVEPIAGSTGVLIPPKGYLERLRQICDRHGVLLVFDEVITAFGRTGTAFAAHTFGVTPDMITCAKALTNAAVPMGGVIVKREIYEAFMQGPEDAIELYHGYTYSGHPLAAAAAVATLDLLEQEGLFQRAAELAPYLEDAVHSLAGLPHVIDIRNFGMVAAIELEPIAGKPTARAFEAFLRCYEKNLLVRTTGDTIALSPALIIEKRQIDQLVETIGGVLKTLP